MRHLKGQLWEIFGEEITSYSDSFINQTARILAISSGAGDLDHYMSMLSKKSELKGKFMEALNVQYSQFNRHMLMNSYTSKVLIPRMLLRCQGKKRLRLWSAGCSAGEEPYSLAIQVNAVKEYLEPEGAVDIFATDIDDQALAKARQGLYPKESLMNLPFGQVEKNFTKTDRGYQLCETIRQMVTFSHYDLLDSQRLHPPEAIYGSFDIVICCNVLYYYKADKRRFVMDKLISAVKSGGYLMVDEITADSGFEDSRLTKVCLDIPIYQVYAGSDSK